MDDSSGPTTGSAGPARRWPRRAAALAAAVAIVLAFAGAASILAQRQQARLTEIARDDARARTDILAAMVRSGVVTRDPLAVAAALRPLLESPDAGLALVVVYDGQGAEMVQRLNLDLATPDPRPLAVAVARVIATGAAETWNDSGHVTVVAPVVGDTGPQPVGALAAAWSLDRHHAAARRLLGEQAGLLVATAVAVLLALTSLFRRAAADPAPRAVPASVAPARPDTPPPGADVRGIVEAIRREANDMETAVHRLGATPGATGSVPSVLAATAQLDDAMERIRRRMETNRRGG